MDGITLVSISNSNQFPNTGLDQICKCLRDNGHFVNVKYFHNGESVEQMTTELIGLNASIYGFSTSALNIKLIESICKKIKKIKKDTKIIVGGPFSTLYYNEILNDMPEIDYIILGDGEEAMLHLIENESKAEFDKCIVTHQKLKNGSCIFPHYENVSGKFKPAEDFYLMNRNPLTIYTLSSKNNVCTGNCSFCCERKHGKILYRPVEDIVDEILDINRRYNIVRFFFIDDDLLDPNDVVARDRIEQMCDMLINSGKHLLIQCYTKTNNFRVNTKSLLKKWQMQDLFLYLLV